MDCLNCQEHFAEMLEGATGEATVAAHSHLAGCEDCRRAFAAYQRTVAAVRDLPLVAPPAFVLPGIYSALNLLTPRRRPFVALWQPLTAGLSLAACLALVVWAVVLGPQAQFAPVAGPGGGTARLGANSAASRGEAGASLSRPGSPRSARLRAEANTRRLPAARRAGARLALAPTVPQLPAMGNWAGAFEPEVFPGARTFGAADAVVPATPVAPAPPTPGPIQLTFTPPAERSVGVPVVGELVIDSQGTYDATVRVMGQRGLRVPNAREGVLYSGPVQKGKPLRLPVKLLAVQSGTQRLRLVVEANLAEARTELEVIVPGFTGELTNAGSVVVTLRFVETPLRQAARELAAASGARVVVHEGVPEVHITQDYSAGVPVAAALRVLAEAADSRVEERDGVFHLLK